MVEKLQKFGGVSKVKWSKGDRCVVLDCGYVVQNRVSLLRRRQRVRDSSLHDQHVRSSDS